MAAGVAAAEPLGAVAAPVAAPVAGAVPVAGVLPASLVGAAVSPSIVVSCALLAFDTAFLAFSASLPGADTAGLPVATLPVVIGVGVVTGSALLGFRTVIQATRKRAATARTMRIGGEIWLTSRISARARPILSADRAATLPPQPIQAYVSVRCPARAAAARRPAPARRSAGPSPLAVFGNAITSRIESRPAMSATMRSRPSAMPPCGGAP